MEFVGSRRWRVISVRCRCALRVGCGQKVAVDLIANGLGDAKEGWRMLHGEEFEVCLCCKGADRYSRTGRRSHPQGIVLTLDGVEIYGLFFQNEMRMSRIER